MEDWEAWRTLLAVARTGRLSAAAALLGVDATTAGRRVRRLEADLGRPLLGRAGGLLVPTQACRDLLPGLETAERALREAGAALRRGPEAPDGPGWRVVRVTAVAVLCDHLLAPAAPRLVADRPALGLELIAEDRNLSLTRREADLAVRLGPLSAPHAGAREIGRLDYGVYAAAGAAAPERLPWAALDAAQGHLPEVRHAERQAGRPGPRHRASRLETLRRLALAGGVRSVLPDVMAARDSRLQRLGNGPAVSRPVYLIGHPEDAEAPAVRAVAAWIEGLFAGPAGPAEAGPPLALRAAAR